MRKGCFLLVFIFFATYISGEKIHDSVKLKDVADFYTFIEKESQKICGKKSCEIRILKTSKEMLIWERCDECDEKLSIDIKKCEKKYPDYVSWVNKNFKDNDKIYYARIEFAPDIPCTAVMDGPYVEYYYANGKTLKFDGTTCK